MSGSGAGNCGRSSVNACLSAHVQMAMTSRTWALYSSVDHVFGSGRSLTFGLPLVRRMRKAAPSARIPAETRGFPPGNASKPHSSQCSATTIIRLRLSVLRVVANVPEGTADVEQMVMPLVHGVAREPKG